MKIKNLPGAWMLETFRRGGVDIDKLMKQLPDDVELMLYEMDSIPPDNIDRLLKACADISGNQDFGLTINELVDITMYGLFGYILLHSNTVEDLLNSLVRYHSVHHNAGIFYNLICEDHIVKIQFCYHQTNCLSHRHTTDWGLGFIPYFIKPLLGNIAQPISACFTYDAPPSLRGLHHYFGTNLEFNQVHNELIYPCSILKQRITEKTDPVLLKILREEADKLLLEQKKDNSLKKAIHIFIFENIGVNKINSSDAAKTFNLSLSTFKRKMAAECIDFKKEKESIRNVMAKQLLSRTTLPVSEIAEKTGFSNASSFTRFFIRCNRQNPLQFRNSSRLNEPKR
ncbi:MAG: hypothetical protein DRQ61_07175 [Gammaproteobacteria bacterium]|nr:MAG: hypothetical protein DRQ61_07175 [Gammaproteobacteria bacterium]